MRTLKKTLCLVLCLAMMAGLCAVCASAEFTDADEIEYKDAVAVLTGIGVIDGFEAKDGTFTFQPDGTLTRAQACKILAMLLDIDQYAGECTFADCKTHWAKSYIAACAAEKIVIGYDENTFGPDDLLTGSAWAKMLLCALGYDAEHEGMIGAEWEYNTIKLAKSKNANLTKGIATGFALPEKVKRDEACQMAFTALTVPMKEFNPGMKIEGTGLSLSTGGSYNPDFNATLLADVLGVKKASNVVVTALVDATPTTAAGFEATANITEEEPVYVDYLGDALSIEMIGHTVDVYYTVNPLTGVNTTKAVVDHSKVVAVEKALTKQTVAQVKALLGVTAVPTANVKGVSNYVVGTEALEEQPIAAANNVYTVAAGEYIITGKAVSYFKSEVSTVEVLDVAKVAATKSVPAYYTVKLGENVLVNTNAVTAGAKKDLILNDDDIDWTGFIKAGAPSGKAVMIVTAIGGTKYAVAPVETVEGKVTNVNVTKGIITVDGVAYYYGECADAVATALGAGVAAVDDEAAAALSYANTYLFYLDEAGEIMASKVVATADTNTYADAFLLDAWEVEVGHDSFGGNKYEFYVQYFTTDGTIHTETLAKINNTKVGHVDSAKAVAYNTLNDGSWVKVAEIDGGVAMKANATAADVTLANDTPMKATTTTLAGKIITKDTVFLYTNAGEASALNEDATVKTGAHKSTLTAGTYKAIVKNSANNAGLKEIVAIVVGDNFTVTTTDFAFVVGYEGQVAPTATGDEQYAWLVIDKAGEEKTLITQTAYNAALISTYRVVSTVDDVITLGAVYENTDLTVKTKTLEDLEKLVVDDVTYLSGDIADDVQIIDLRAAVVDEEVDAAADVDDVIELAADTTHYVVTAMYTTNAATNINTLTTIIIVDVAN